MKKSIVTLAMAVALNITALSASVLSTPVYASDDAGILANSSTDNDTQNNNRLFQGMGIGAIAGTLVAGPVGLVVGSLIGTVTGAILDDSSLMDSQTKTDTALAITNTGIIHHRQPATNSVVVETKPDNPTITTQDKPENIQLAQLGSTSVATIAHETEQNKLMNILTADVRFDIYFRSGSDDIETFYLPRLTAIANLLKNTDSLDIHLDGYADRRGNKEKNIALAKDRINKVRQQLIDNGIDQHRIISTAFGERKMVSSPGDLSAYAFDRKVEIHFEPVKSEPQTTLPIAVTDHRESAAVAANTPAQF